MKPKIETKFSFSNRSERIEKQKLDRVIKTAKISGYIVAVLLIILGAFSVYEYINSHTFRSPVLIQFQSPVVKVENKIVSPLSQKIVKKAYAEEVKNPYDSNSPKGIAWEQNRKMFGVEHWEALEELITKESGWNPFARNGSSGACGLGQAMPCEKMDCEEWEYSCQVNWTLEYILNRYGNPSQALTHWLARVPLNGKDVGNWY